MAFTYPLDEYKRNHDIVGEYVSLMANGVSRMKGISKEEAEAYVRSEVSKVDLDKFILHFTYRGKTEDREFKQAPLLKFISTMVENRWTMSPSMTTYLKPDVKLSYATAVIAEDQSKRSRVKKEAQQAKQAGDTTGATIGKGIQNAIKFLVNSWSGAALSPSTPYFNPSMHPTLTSFCRISTALATATAERLIAGKCYFHTPDRVTEAILVNMDKVDRSAIERTLQVYGLVTPSHSDVMEFIEASTKYYWDDDKAMVSIEALALKMDGIERAGFVYYGNLFHLYKLNPEVIGEFLSVSAQGANIANNDGDSSKLLDSDMRALVSNLLGSTIKGKTLRDATAESAEVAEMARRVSNNIINVFEVKYRRLIETLFRVPYFPIDSARQYNATRKSVALGDTDSTVFSTGPICELHYGTRGYSEEFEPINDVVTYLINGTITHALSAFTGQMDIDPSLRDLLAMKNEFKMPIVQLTPAGKTYHALVKAEEGNVYAKPEWELKGSRFHSGRSNKKVIKAIHEWMREGKVKLNSGGKVNRGELVDIILDVEHDLRDSLHRKDNVYFKIVKVKPKEQYANPMGLEWGKHELYNIMFSDTHGKAPDPIYTAYKVNLNFPEGIEKWFNKLDPKYQARYKKWMDVVGVDFKKPPTYILIPTDNFKLHGLPDMFLNVVDLRKLALASLDAAYLNLSSVGICLDYKPDGKGLLLSDIMDD
jgi:hypothetical protein